MSCREGEEFRRTSRDCHQVSGAFLTRGHCPNCPSTELLFVTACHPASEEIGGGEGRMHMGVEAGGLVKGKRDGGRKRKISHTPTVGSRGGRLHG